MTPYYEHAGITIYCGDCREILPHIEAESIACCVTSPPYWSLRDYGTEGQLGREQTPEAYVAQMVEVFRGVRRVLREGTLWLNLGDSYANDGKWGGATGGKHAAALHGDPIGRGKRNTGLKPKDLVGIPWRVAFALQADGWYLRSDIIWSKPNPMPESVTDRPTKAHEYLFLLANAEQYHYDAEAIQERGTGRASRQKRNKYVEEYERSETEEHRTKAGLLKIANVPWKKSNKRSVWSIPTRTMPEAHFATFPEALVEPCIKAGCPPGGTVLDPFGGSGTVALVAKRLGCRAAVIELNEAYCEIAARRVAQDVFEFSPVIPGRNRRGGKPCSRKSSDRRPHEIFNGSHCEWRSSRAVDD